MERQSWANILSSVSEEPETCLLLQQDTWYEDFQAAEQILGQSLPPVVQIALAGWIEQGARLLLEVVPQILNPGATAGSLNATGRDMCQVFPEFCQMLKGTKHFSVIIDRARSRAILFAGLAEGIPNSRMKQWSYYLPQPLEMLARQEEQTQIHLSPQLRQMYLRAGGTTNESICPYFYAQDALEKGWLYDDIYRDALDQVPLNAETVERLQAFVPISANLTGDTQGFFIDERRADSEYSIYEWDHERLEFALWAEDFAGAIGRKLVGSW